MRRYRHLPTTLIPLVLLSGTALADDAALLGCRAISDAVARLTCYDAIPVTGVEAKATPGQPSPASQQSMQELFGKEESIAPPAGLPPIETNIPGRFEGWGPEYANCQVWQVADGSSRIYDMDNPKVTITRGMLGRSIRALPATTVLYASEESNSAAMPIWRPDRSPRETP